MSLQALNEIRWRTSRADEEGRGERGAKSGADMAAATAAVSNITTAVRSGWTTSFKTFKWAYSGNRLASGLFKRIMIEE